MIKVKEKKNCCGCAACSQICPQQCIFMKEDEEGFLYPEIDSSQCIDCSLCERICPIINYKRPKPECQMAAVVQTKNQEILRQSTSGGAFTAIAEYVIEHDGIVFGVEMDENFNVKHTYTDKKQELYKYRNSKYVQSNIENTFKQVKKFLDDNRMVCFSGTPCQIEGLINYLGGEEYENLILVDVVCRAVPSPGVWRKYITYLNQNNEGIKSLRFRDKSLGYQYSTMEIRYQNGKIAREGIESDSWLRMFFSGMIIRPSCADCKFRSISRRSDFTIWDCFNIYHIDKKFDESLGVTRVFIHSEKGKKIFDNIKGNFELRSISTEIAVKNVTELVVSPQINSKREQFYQDLNKLSIENVLDKYFPLTLTVKFKRFARRKLNQFGLDINIKHLFRKG